MNTNESFREDDVVINESAYHVVFDAYWEPGDSSTGWPSGYIVTVHTVFDENGLPYEPSDEELNDIETILADRLENE